MECNRDEAIRAKTVAEKKFADKDFAGAKRFTLKAQTLYPELDGLSQMLITLDVYISSESKINGESDWYGVLDVKPLDDDETIRKQYRKMVLLLHPDKNKSVGADGAFKILSEAWSLLSDKSKRSAYNQRRNSRGLQPKVPPSASSSPGVNVVNTPANKATAKQKVWKTGRVQVPPTVPAKAQAPGPPPGRASGVNGSDTFWTVCLGCKMHYEYHKVNLNVTIQCSRCHKPFRAVECPTPIKSFKNVRCSSSVHGKADPCVASEAAKFINRLKRDHEEIRAVDGLKRDYEEYKAQLRSKRRFDAEVSYQRSARS